MGHNRTLANHIVSYGRSAVVVYSLSVAWSGGKERDDETEIQNMDRKWVIS